MDESQRQGMQALLRADPAIKQASILALSPTTPEDLQWTVAISLADAAYTDGGDALAIKAARKSLVKEFGKGVVPKKWLMPGDLPAVAGSEEIDEDALRAKLLGSVPDAAGPQTVEDKVIRVASMVLRLPPADVSLDKSFTQLGGDSITAIELMSRLVEEEVPLRVPDIVSKSTLAELIATVPLPEPSEQPTAGVNKAPTAATVSVTPLAA